MRFKSLILAGLMLLFGALPALAATLNLGTVSGTPGQNVTVPITLTNSGASIASVGIDIGYDPAKLTPIAIAPATKPGVIGAAGTAAGKTVIQNQVSAGLYRIGVTSLTDTTLIGDGVVATISFAVAAGTSGNVTLTNTPSASSAAGTPVAITGANGQVTLPVIPPSITAFTLPSTGTSLIVNFTTLTASANTAAYLISENSTKPLANDTRWTTTKPTSYTFTTYGAKTLWAWAKDSGTTVSTAGVSASTTITAPLATVTAFVIPTTVYSTTIPITTFTASNAVAYLITESATPPAASAITAATAPTTFTVSGFTAHTLYAWVKNAAGIVSVPFAGQTVTVSEKPAPVLTVNTKDNNSYTNNDTLTITGSATKNPASGATGVISSVKVNNGAALTLDGAGNFSTAVTLVPGANTINVVAADSDTPPVTTTDSRVINYDTTAPAITFIAPTPANNSQVKTAAVTIKGTVPETATVTVAQNGGEPQAAIMTGTTFSFNTTLVDGDNTFNVLATDLAGNINTQQLQVKLDTVNPQLLITDPAQDITTTFSTWLVKGTTEDNNAIASLVFKVDGIAVTPAPVITDDNFQQQVTLSGGASNTRAISVTVTDIAGNATTVQRNIIYKPLALADAQRALKISVGLVEKTAADDVLDVAPLDDGKPKGDTFVDAADAGVILRKIVGLENW